MTREEAKSEFVRGALTAIDLGLHTYDEEYQSMLIERFFDEHHANDYPLEAGDTVYVSQGDHNGHTGVFLGILPQSIEHARVKIGDDVEIIPLEFLILS